MLQKSTIILHTSKIENIIWLFHLEEAKVGGYKNYKVNRRWHFCKRSSKRLVGSPFYINSISISRFEPVPPLIPQGAGMLIFAMFLHSASSQQAAAASKNNPPDRTDRRTNHIEDGGQKHRSHRSPKVDPQRGPPIRLSGVGADITIDKNLLFDFGCSKEGVW